MPRKPIGDRAMTAAERQRRHRGDIVTTMMTKAERDDLQRLVRQREKVLKTAASQRSAELLADFEQQIASIYSYDQDEIWRQAHDAAEAVVADARQVIAARCTELGIPAEFAPSLGFHWRGRGRNVVKERRDELRQVAKSRIAAIEKEACTKIEMHCLQTSTEILAHGLSSAAARDFLAQMPALTQLMPPLDMHQVALMLEARKADERPRYGGYDLMPEPSE